MLRNGISKHFFLRECIIYNVTGPVRYIKISYKYFPSQQLHTLFCYCYTLGSDVTGEEMTSLLIDLSLDQTRMHLIIFSCNLLHGHAGKHNLSNMFCRQKMCHT